MDHHSKLKVKEDDEFVAELFNYSNPTLDQIMKFEPFETCPDENLILKPMPPPCVLHRDSDAPQVLPESGSGTAETETKPPRIQPELGTGTTEMEDDEQPPPQVQPEVDTGATEIEDDEEFWPLSGKPFFSVILTKTCVKQPYCMAIPSEMAKELPCATVPVVLRYFGKNWDMVYHGSPKKKKLSYTGWRKFVEDNKLKVDYGCFFELVDCSRQLIKLRVQIFKTEGLPFYIEDDEGDGETPETPFFIN